ncbi:DUF6082 family protein [Nocardia noduli]|uniref:DUF6082 family protein n=1 Tax=Nocardia noduli TaxID=2815722 RepID=UPI001C210A96|nr:DUF6082 family protein [Nocardia noduli]
MSVFQGAIHMSTYSRRQAWTDRAIGWFSQGSTGRIAVGAAVIIGGVSAVLVSPFLLLLLPAQDGADWWQLRQVSQTYGATTAIVSALALCGVSVSLFIQARQFKASRFENIRRHHLDLTRIAMDEPTIFAPCIGRRFDPPGVEGRQFYYTASWMRYGRMGYESGVISEQILRDDVLGAVFRSDIGRDYWAQTSKFWAPGKSGYNRRTRTFKRIADEEYQKAIATGPAPITWEDLRASQQTTVAPEQPSPARRTRWLATGSIALVVGSAVALGVAVSKANRLDR